MASEGGRVRAPGACLSRVRGRAPQRARLRIESQTGRGPSGGGGYGGRTRKLQQPMTVLPGTQPRRKRPSAAARRRRVPPPPLPPGRAGKRSRKRIKRPHAWPVWVLHQIQARGGRRPMHGLGRGGWGSRRRAGLRPLDRSLLMVLPPRQWQRREAAERQPARGGPNQGGDKGRPAVGSRQVRLQTFNPACCFLSGEPTCAVGSLLGSVTTCMPTGGRAAPGRCAMDAVPAMLMP